MFGKKILSLIGLLFLGSQISSVSAGDCDKLVHNNKIVDNCGVCDSNGLYLVTGKVEDESHDILVNVSISDGTASCTTIDIPGYYVDVDGKNFYVVDGTNNYATQANVITDGNCVNGSIKDRNLCLDNENTVAFDSDEKYVFKDAANLFGLGKDVDIVIKTVNGNSIVKDTYTESEICVRDSHAIFGSKSVSYCKDDCAYYDFDNGVATLSTINRRANDLPPVDSSYCNPAIAKPVDDAATEPSSYHCAAGYYIVNETPETPIVITAEGDDGETGSETGVLYYCATDKIEDKCRRIEAADASPGYYVNAYYNKGVKYIQCDGDYCKGFFNDVESCVKAGDIVISGGALSLCITDNDKTPISLSDSSKYFVDVASTSTSAFRKVGKDDYSIIVEIDAQKAVVPARKNDPPRKYKYANSSAKIFDSHDDDACSTGTTVTEYELFRESKDDEKAHKYDKYDYYKKGNTIDY